MISKPEPVNALLCVCEQFCAYLIHVSVFKEPVNVGALNTVGSEQNLLTRVLFVSPSYYILTSGVKFLMCIFWCPSLVT